MPFSPRSAFDGDDPARHLDLIAEMMTAYARASDVEASLRVGLTRAVEQVDAEAGSLFLLDAEAGELVCRASVGPVDVAALRLAPGSGIVWRTVASATCQTVDDARHDPDFTGSIDAATGFVTRSILCAPMMVGSRPLGAIELFNKRGTQPFGVADRRLLMALAAASALAVVNARLLDDLAGQETLRRDLALAADIQRAMLPPPQPADFPVHGVNLPARGVSGDFFEVVPLPGGRVAFAIGDVSGKGMNAALLMARTASLFRCLIKRDAGPGPVLAAIDAELQEVGRQGMFVTMAAGVLDPATGRVILANAGQEPPVLWQRDGFVVIEEGMPPLGVEPALFAGGCPETVINLDGGILYLYTDGLTEARGRDGAMLGSEGVRGLLDLFATVPVTQRLRAVLRAIDGDGALADDATLLAVEDRRATAAPAHLDLFAAHPETLARIRDAVAAVTTRLGASGQVVADCVLAVDEACQNIIRHAYHGGEGEIVLQVSRRDDHVIIRLIDFAPPADTAKIRSRALDDLRPGGLGLHLMRSVMDTVVFLPPPAGIGNLLEMTKRIEAT